MKSLKLNVVELEKRIAPSSTGTPGNSTSNPNSATPEGPVGAHPQPIAQRGGNP